MKKTIWVLLSVLAILALTMASAYAASISDVRLPLVENNVPHIIDVTTERLLESLLQDILERDYETEIRFIAIQNRDLSGMGNVISFEEYRDNILMNFGRDYLNSRLVYIMIWSIDESRLFISVPSRSVGRISQTTVDHIVQTELIGPAFDAGVPLQTAMFNTLSHLGRYLSVATGISSRYDQSLVPDGVPYMDFDVYTVPEATATTSSQPSTEPLSVEESADQFNDDMRLMTTQSSSQSGSSNTLIIIVGVILVAVIVVLLIIRKRRSEEYYDGEYDDANDEDIDVNIEVD